MNDKKVKRIPPQRKKPTTSAPRSSGSIGNLSWQDRADHLTKYFCEDRRYSKPVQNVPELGNSSDFTVTAQDDSDDVLDIGYRKSRRLEGSTVPSDTRRHQSLTKLKLPPISKIKKEETKSMEEQAPSDCDVTFEENWSFSDQIELDYKLDSDSSLEDSPVLRATKDTASPLTSISYLSHDTIGDIDKLLLETTETQNPVYVPQSSGTSKFGGSQAPQLNISSQITQDILVNEPKSELIGVSENAPESSVNTQQQLTEHQGAEQDKVQDPVATFEVPSTDQDFKLRLGDLTNTFAVTLSNMVEAIQ
ncbi:hypothetical protein BGZ76_007584 [Entomortierella beljakovae]|nr:hypothetical protein BGZ76_007584 [Entomortierella beljakovae]